MHHQEISRSWPFNFVLILHLECSGMTQMETAQKVKMCWCPIQGRLPVPRCPRLGTREQMSWFHQNLMPTQRSMRKPPFSPLASFVIDLQNLKTVTAFPIESPLLRGFCKSTKSHTAVNSVPTGYQAQTTFPLSFLRAHGETFQK